MLSFSVKNSGMSSTDVVQKPETVDCVHVAGQGERGAQAIELRHPVGLNYILNYFRPRRAYIFKATG